MKENKELYEYFKQKHLDELHSKLSTNHNKIFDYMGYIFQQRGDCVHVFLSLPFNPLTFSEPEPTLNHITVMSDFYKSVTTVQVVGTNFSENIQNVKKEIFHAILNGNVQDDFIHHSVKPLLKYHNHLKVQIDEIDLYVVPCEIIKESLEWIASNDRSWEESAKKQERINKGIPFNLFLWYKIKNIFI